MRAILEGDQLGVLFLGGDFDDGAQRPPRLNESHALFLQHIPQDVQVAVGHQQCAKNKTRDTTLNAVSGWTGGQWSPAVS